jgi:hypothetical protein
VNNSFLVEVAKSKGNLNGIEFDLLFFESFMRLEEPVEFASSNEGHDEEESELRHE